MPPLGTHQSANTTKLLLIGDSGGGKTGALASLAQAGYNLRIIDLDNGLDILKNLLKDPAGPYGADAIKRVSFATITDPMKNVGGKLIPRSATVWQRTAKLLDNWKILEKDSEGKDQVVEDFGPITSWTDKEVLVIDSLSFLSNAALNFVMSLEGRLGQRPQLQDWGAGQQHIESLVQMLYDEGVKCNVIVTSHITFIGEEGSEKGYPNTLGRALPPKIGRYFNTTLQVLTTGVGANRKRKIVTKSSSKIELKNSSPLRVADEYPLESGLADYFRDVRK